MKYTIVELSKLSGLSRGTLYVYGNRGKLLIEDGIVDSSKEVNVEFFKSKNIVEEKTAEATQESPTEIKPEKIEEKKNTGEKVSAAQKINILKASKLNEEVKYFKLRNEKLEGMLVPVDIVGRATAEVIHRYKAAFVQAADQLIRDYMNTLQSKPELITEALSKLTDIANDASRRAIEETRITLENSKEQ